MELLRRVWNVLRVTEKLLLGASVAVIAICAIFSWRSSGQAKRGKVILREAPDAAQVQWQDADKLTVDVAGAVHRPGVYTLSSGARVRDAVRLAGGVLPDAAIDELNLAATLQDGEQVRVGEKGGKSTFAESTFDADLIDINHASAEELQQLPGVGPVLAQRIMEFRRTRGAFRHIDDLNAVPGVGAKRLEEWRPLIKFR